MDAKYHAFHAYALGLLYALVIAVLSSRISNLDEPAIWYALPNILSLLMRLLECLAT